MTDFIEMDHAAMLRQIAELDRQLADMSAKVSNEIIDTVALEAAGELQNEQKRLLAAAPSAGIRGLASDLAIWKYGNRNTPRKVAYRVGYPADKISKSIKYFVIEYGRPGKKNKAKDSKGRRIGRIQPYSHIRAAWFNKKDHINRYIARRFDEEIRRRWERNR